MSVFGIYESGAMSGLGGDASSSQRRSGFVERLSAPLFEA